jgi:hypothetical protein
MPDIEIPKPDEILETARDRFTKKVALTVAIYAVALTLATLGGNGVGKDAMMAQQRASNEWARFQAKAIRGHLYDLERERSEQDMLEKEGTLNETVRKRKQDHITKLADTIARYEIDKKEIEVEARKYEAKRDDCQTRDPYFDYGEVLLQIAIVCASVAMLAGSRSMFAGSLVMAVIGMYFTANGYFLFLRLAFMEG